MYNCALDKSISHRDMLHFCVLNMQNLHWKPCVDTYRSPHSANTKSTFPRLFMILFFNLFLRPPRQAARLQSPSLLVDPCYSLENLSSCSINSLLIILSAIKMGNISGFAFDTVKHYHSLHSLLFLHLLPFELSNSKFFSFLLT